MINKINKSTFLVLALCAVLYNTPSLAAAALEGDLQKNVKVKRDKRRKIEKRDFDKQIFGQLVNEQLAETGVLPYLEDKDIILVLGETGVGKSTVINRMLGYLFYWSTNEGQVIDSEDFDSSDDDAEVSVLRMEENEKIKQKAYIGEDYNSGTKVPQVYTLYPENLVLVDCPGFKDTGKEEQELLNLLMIRLFVEKARKVKYVICLLSYEKILGGSGRGNDFLYLARELDYLFNFQNHMDNILWCFTRYPRYTRNRHIIAKLQEIKAAKESMKSKFADHVWQHSDCNKDYMLISQVLDNPGNIFRAGPCINDNKVARIKNFLAKDNETFISKEAFRFNHPNLDIKGIVKEHFNEKTQVLEVYKKYIDLKKHIATNQKHKIEIEHALKGGNSLKAYITRKEQENIAQIEELEKKCSRLKDKIAKIKATEEELVLYRTEHVDLKSNWLNDTKQITYRDLRFHKVEARYDKDNITENQIEYLPAQGIYEVAFTATGKLKPVLEYGGSGGLIGSIGGAGLCVGGAPVVGAALAGAFIGGAIGGMINEVAARKVEVAFYVKKGTIQGNLAKDLQNELDENDKQLKIFQKSKSSIKDETINDLEDQLHNILPAQIKAYEEDLLAKEKTLHGNKALIYLIGEVYPFLYPNVHDSLSHFAKQYKDSFALFKKPEAIQNDGEEEKKEDIAQETQKESSEKPPIGHPSQESNGHQNDLNDINHNTCAHGISAREECKECEHDMIDID